MVGVIMNVMGKKCCVPHSQFLMGAANKNTMDRVIPQVTSPVLTGQKIIRQLSFTQLLLRSFFHAVVQKSKMELNYYLIYAEKIIIFFQNRHLAELAVSVLHSMVLRGSDIQ